MSDLTGQVLDDVFLSLLSLMPPKNHSGFSLLMKNEKQLASHA